MEAEMSFHFFLKVLSAMVANYFHKSFEGWRAGSRRVGANTIRARTALTASGTEPRLRPDARNVRGKNSQTRLPALLSTVATALRLAVNFRQRRGRPSPYLEVPRERHER